MFFNYSKDYIKYLNDERAGRLTYDQWKEIILKHDEDEDNQSNDEKGQDPYGRKGNFMPKGRLIWELPR